MSVSLSLVPQAGKTWRRYPTYTNSGVEWLGKIPAHWRVMKVKRLCLVRRGASPRPIDNPIYFDEAGECSWVRISDVTASTKYLWKTEQRLSALGKSKSVPLEPGRLFVSIAATVGKPIITKIRRCIHDGFVYFVGLKEDQEYLFYVFSSGELYKGLGKLGTQLNLNTDTIADIRIPVPGKAEQARIAIFLDHETAKIDALIAKRQQLIALLEDKRTALISRAVTKGLDPNVQMKDSGVSWAGKLPKHWKLTKLKYLVKSLQTGPFGTQLHAEQYIEDGIPVINPANLEDGKIIPNLKCTVDQIVFDRLSRHRLSEGDIIFARRGEMGRCALVSREEDGWLCGTGCLRVCPDTVQVYPPFLSILLSTKGAKDWFTLESVGSTMENLNTEIIGRIPLAAPDVSEQRRIAEEVAAVSCRVDSIIIKNLEAIEKLQEFRTALISAAVTGKIDVRGEVS